MIQCDQVGYRVESQGGASHFLIHPLSFEARPGEVTLVRGRSGAGKSTLIAMISGVLRPTEGQVLFQGESVSRYSAAHRDLFRRRVGLVAQRLHLFEDLTPLENVWLPNTPRRRSGGQQRAEAMLEVLQVPSSRPVRTLSVGEQQRVAIARALSTEPDLLVLDEPTAHQDTERLELIVDLIQSSLKRQCTVVIAAHDPRLDTALGANSVLTLERGELVSSQVPSPS